MQNHDFGFEIGDFFHHKIIDRLTESPVPIHVAYHRRAGGSSIFSYAKSLDICEVLQSRVKGRCVRIAPNQEKRVTLAAAAFAREISGSLLGQQETLAALPMR